MYNFLFYSFGSAKILNYINQKGEFQLFEKHIRKEGM